MDGRTGAEATPPSSSSAVPVAPHSTQQAADALGAMTQASGAQPESGGSEGAPAVPVPLSQQGAAEPAAQQPGAPALEQQQNGSQLLLALPTNGSKAAAMVALPPQGEAHKPPGTRACGCFDAVRRPASSGNSRPQAFAPCLPIGTATTMLRLLHAACRTSLLLRPAV